MRQHAGLSDSSTNRGGPKERRPFATVGTYGYEQAIVMEKKTERQVCVTCS